jgi:hypothetical protein
MKGKLLAQWKEYGILEEVSEIIGEGKGERA